MMRTWTLMFGVLLMHSLSFAYNTENFTITSEMCAAQEAKTPNGLNCPSYKQTTTYTCGPAVAMEILHYYGRLPTSAMNHETEMHYANDMGTTEKTGTPSSDLASWLSSHGFNVQTGTNVTSDIILSNLKKGIPTLVAMDGHWLLAKGYDKSGIFFADSCCGTQVVPFDLIDSMWQTSHLKGKHCPGNVGSYIVATPK